MEAFHPPATHLPLALLLLWPLIDLLGLTLARPDVSKTALALLVLALLGALAATVTGQAAYDVAIAAQVTPEILDTHADDANLVPWAGLLILGVRFAGVRRYGRRAHWLAIGLGFLLAGFMVHVGDTGGDLVFEHGIGVVESLQATGR